MLDGKSNESPTPPSLEGRYRPYAFHAQGGIGQVFRAADGEVGRDVALKVIRPDAQLNLGAKYRANASAMLREAVEAGKSIANVDAELKDWLGEFNKVLQNPNP